MNDFIRQVILAALQKNIDELNEAKAKLESAIADIEELKKKYSDAKPEAAYILFYQILENGNLKEIKKMFLQVSKKLPVSIEIKDKFGNAAKVDGAPQWALSVPEMGALVVAEGGLSAEFVPGGTVGVLKVQVKCDADLGEGVKEILGELEIELIAGEAEVVELKAGEAV